MRAEVRLSTDRQRATAAANDAQKAKLQLARVIGLPIGQEFTLVDDIPLVPDAGDDAASRRSSRRIASAPDYLAALGARAGRGGVAQGARVGERLPSVRVTADYGAIGLTAGTSLPTFNVTGAVDVPIFEGGRTQGRLAQADAELRDAARRSSRTCKRRDLLRRPHRVPRSRGDRSSSCRRRRAAASWPTQQLTQSRDRFAAGVASNIEVVQAQEAVARRDRAVHQRAVRLQRRQGAARAIHRHAPKTR